MPTYGLLLLAVLTVTGSAYGEERHRSNSKQPLYVKYARSNYQNTNLGPVLFPSESNENGSATSRSASEDLSPLFNQNTNLGPVLFPTESNENESPTSHSASEDLSPVLSSARGTQESEVEYDMRVEDSSAVVRDGPIGPPFLSGYEPYFEYSPDWKRLTARYEELAAARRPPTEHYSQAHYFPHPDSTAYADGEPPVLEAPPIDLKLLKFLELPLPFL